MFFLIITVPWFFTDFTESHILGFPTWAFYTIVSSIIYAAVIFFFLERYWDVSKGQSERPDEEEQS